MEFLPTVFAKGRLPLSYSIRFFTWSRWSHCAVLHDGYLKWNGQEFNGLKVLEAYGFLGVVVTPWDEFIGRYKVEDIAFGLLPVIDSRDAAYQRLISELGLDYDWSMLIGILLRTGWDNPKKRVCSEYVGYGAQLYRSERISRVTPEHIWMNCQPWDPDINNILLPT